MQPLLDLVRQAEAEVGRVLQICNACRYCEGFCAVFPAMARRLQFDDSADVQYLAHLCHNCGACLHACQYAPPHEFAVNVPQAMAPLRRLSYQQHTWPAALGGAWRRHGLVVSVVLVVAFALCLLLAARPAAGGSFYSVIPHGLMVGLFVPVFGYALLALGVAVGRFWRQADPGPVPAAALAEAAHDAATLRYLDGGHGQGCTNDDDAWTQARRHAHHALAGGFMLCFAATAVGTLYHYALGWVAPYGWTSLPKLLGTSGGVLMLIGGSALLALRARRHPLHVDAGSATLDLGLILLLVLIAASGLALALAAGSAWMPGLLCVHLATVLSFFVTLPYGKFAHGAYRAAALLKYAVERRQPSRLRLGGD